MFWYLLFLILFLIVVNIMLNYNRTARLLRKVPGPKMAFIIGNALETILPPGEKKHTFSYANLSETNNFGVHFYLSLRNLYHFL